MGSTSSKVVLLTGGASGIGKHLAGRLTERGHRVFCTDVDVEGMHRWIERHDVSSAQLATQKLDVRQPVDWKRAVDGAIRTFGSIDVVMNIAGYLCPGYLCEVGPGEVDMHIDVNLKGVIFGTRVAARRMVEQGYGHIINVGSLASLTPVPGLSLYGASKFGVRGFSLSAAEELRSQGVDVSVVLLDAVETPMLELQADCEEAALTFSGSRPLELREVEQLIVDEVLVDRPLEVTLPRRRGLIAKFAGVLPDLVRLLRPLLEKRGRSAQQNWESSD